jgi:hypothetical protein
VPADSDSDLYPNERATRGRPQAFFRELHRAKDHGLRVDEYGDTLDPDVLRERLKILGQFVSNDADGARFDATIGLAFDAEKMEKLRSWRLAFLSRYGHQQVQFMQDMPIIELWRLVDGISDLMRKETALQSQFETNA